MEKKRSSYSVDNSNLLLKDRSALGESLMSVVDKRSAQDWLTDYINNREREGERLGLFAIYTKDVKVRAANSLKNFISNGLAIKPTAAMSEGLLGQFYAHYQKLPSDFSKIYNDIEELPLNLQEEPRKFVEKVQYLVTHKDEVQRAYRNNEGVFTSNPPLQAQIHLDEHLYPSWECLSRVIDSISCQLFMIHGVAEKNNCLPRMFSWMRCCGCVEANMETLYKAAKELLLSEESWSMDLHIETELRKINDQLSPETDEDKLNTLCSQLEGKTCSSGEMTREKIARYCKDILCWEVNKGVKRKSI